MSELVTKIIELFKELYPFVVGYFSAKRDTKIDNLKEENEKLKSFNEIDNKPVNVDVFDARVWK